MKLTPIDIKQQQFRRSFRGLEPHEVQAFLELVAQHMGELFRENDALSSEVRRIEHELEQYRDREATLKEAMLTAQRAIDEIREQAQKEAQLIVSEAEIRAEKILHGAHTRSNRILDDLRDLRRQKVRAIEELRAVLETHQKLLNAHETADLVDNEASVTVLDRLRPPPPPRADELGVVQRSSVPDLVGGS